MERTVFDPSGFTSSWEHIRLLSDTSRNSALIALLSRHARGNRVLEAGCGTGLLSCIAARMGAKEVYAVEPTVQADLAEQLARDNGLSQVQVLHSRLEDLEPRPVELAFSELCNADPFYEGVISVSTAARRWLVSDGILAPSRLRVFAALIRSTGSAMELRSAQRQLRELEQQHNLKLGALCETLGGVGPYVYTGFASPVGPPVSIFDVQLGLEGLPVGRTVELLASQPGPVSGVMLWFEAELDDNLMLHNRPGSENHWGQQIFAFPTEIGLRAGGGLAFRFALSGRTVTLESA